MTVREIATRLEKAYSVILKEQSGEDTGGLSGYNMIYELAEDMFKSRNLSGDNAKYDDQIQYIADEMLRVLFDHKASAEGRQGVMEAYAKAYKAKYADVMAEQRAYIEYLENLNKTTPEERADEARKEVFEKAENEPLEDESIYEETEVHQYDDVVKGLKVDGVKFVEKKLKDNPGIKRDKTYMKFEHFTPDDMESNPEYKAIIKAIKEHVSGKNKNGKNGEYGRHTLMRYRWNDPWRCFKLFFKDNYEPMKKIVLDTFRDAKKNHLYFDRFYLTKLKEITADGIVAGSDLSAAVQYYVEYVRSKKELREPPTEEGYIKAGKIYHSLSEADKAKVHKAGELFTWMLDGMLESVNHARRTIYPYAEGYREMLETEYNEIIQQLKLREIAFAEGDMHGMMDYTIRQSKLDAIRARQESAEELIRRKRVIVAEKMKEYTAKIEEVEQELSRVKKDSKRYDDLRNKLARFIEEKERYSEIGKIDEQKLVDKIQILQSQYEDSGRKFVQRIRYDTQRLEKRRDEIMERLSGDLDYGRIIKPREDYFHHIAEQVDGYAQLMGWFSDFMNNGVNRNSGTITGDADKDGAIDLRLAEISGQTKPKASWQGAFQHRTDSMELVRCDAVLSFLAYLPQASQAATIDPHISIIRKLATDLREEGAGNGDNRSNFIASFTKWLDEYANQIAGKTSSFRRFQSYRQARFSSSLKTFLVCHTPQIPSCRLHSRHSII